MIELRPNHWAYPEDLGRSTFGREDPPELVERCISYFSRGGASHRAHKAKGRLISAKTRGRLVQTKRKAGSESLREALDEAEATINRLLAFVPRRAPEIPSERLQEIGREVVAKARDLFQVDVVPIVTPETDEDSQAAHRLTVVAPPGEMEPAEWARRSFVLHRYIAGMLTMPERESLRLSVKPGMAGGSSR